MEIILSGKHYEVSDEIKAAAEQSMRKLAEDYQTQKISSVRLLFTVERNWQIAEVLLNGKNLTLHAKGRTTDMRASLGNAVEKLDKQLRRYLERIQDLSVKADPVAKEKFWTSEELSEAEDDTDLVEA